METNNQCKTTYPILLVHGIGMRDDYRIKYWGRIPSRLEAHGASVFLSNHDAWSTIENNAEVIYDSAQNVLHKASAKKINIIAHSKGGLDSRYMIKQYNMQNEVASLTTISTPHYGSKTMDAFRKMPKWMKSTVATTMNGVAKITGDQAPNIYAMSKQLTTSYCEIFNQTIDNAPQIYYQSYHTAIDRGLVDLRAIVPYWVVRKFDGENDGIVGKWSTGWGEQKGALTPQKNISHIDIMDFASLHRKKKSVPEMYIEIVAGLKQKGL